MKSMLKHLIQYSLPFYLKYIGQDKENGIDLLLSSHCKQTNDPGEGQHRNNDDVGHHQIPVNII